MYKISTKKIVTLFVLIVLGLLLKLDSGEIYAQACDPNSPFSSSVYATDIACKGGSSGTASVYTVGGVLPFTYQWSGSASSQATSSVTGLSAGSYSVTVTDSKGCISNSTAIPSTCFEITQIFVDACTSSDEGEQEFFTFKVGQSALNVTTLNIVWPNNSYLGLCSNPSLTASINSSLKNGSILVEPTGNILPAKSQVLVVTSNALSTSTVLFPQFSDTLYVLYQCSGNTADHFTNYELTNFNNEKKLIVDFGGGCSDTVVYKTDSLSMQNGSIGPENGSGVFFSYSGKPTYFNKGCIAPVDTLKYNSSVTLNEPILSLNVILSTKDVLCFGGNSGEASCSASGGNGAYKYQWDTTTGSQTTKKATGLLKGIYSITVTDSLNCSIVDNVIIDEPSQLTLSVSPNDTICPNVSAKLSAVLTGGTSPYTFSWSNASSDSTITVTPLITTQYTVTGFDTNGCGSLTSAISVIVKNLFKDSLKITSNTSICTGDSVKLFSFYKGNFSPYNYTWDNGIGQVIDSIWVFPTTSTLYKVSVTDNCNSTLVDSINVAVNKTYPLSLPLPIATGCAPLTVVFKDTFNIPGKTFLWDFGNDSTSTLPMDTQLYSNSGTYTVTLNLSSSMSCGQNLIAKGTVEVYSDPVQDCNASPTSVSILDPLVYFGTNNSDNYLWDFDDGDTSYIQNPVHIFKDTGDFRVSIIGTTSDGCKDTCEISVRINPDIEFKVPTAFIPSQSGSNGGFFDPLSQTNDIFFPIMKFVLKYQMQIFNRWGEMVFETKDPNQGWDGYYKGKLCQQDLYIWKISALFDNDKKTKIEKTGGVTLIQ